MDEKSFHNYKVASTQLNNNQTNERKEKEKNNICDFIQQIMNRFLFNLFFVLSSYIINCLKTEKYIVYTFECKNKIK
jgi:hypothetical protein